MTTEREDVYLLTVRYVEDGKERIHVNVFARLEDAMGQENLERFKRTGHFTWEASWQTPELLGSKDVPTKHYRVERRRVL